MTEIEKLAGSVFDSVKAFFGKEFGRLELMIDALRKSIADIPSEVGRDGRDGKQGEKGEPGRDGAAGIDGRDGKDGINGADGKKGDPGERGADGTPGVDGVKGDQGDRGLPGERGDKGDAGFQGNPGQAGERGEVGLIGERGEKGEAGDKGEKGHPGEPGQDGAPGVKGLDGKDGAMGEQGFPGESGRDGRDGQKGEPGRDAAQLDIIPSINEARSYARGTFASHKGGLWRSVRTTDGMNGWECIINGVSDITVDRHQDDPRKFFVSIGTAAGIDAVKEFVIPAMVYKGVFREGDEFTPGDVVTWGGSLWHCNEPTKDKPIDGSKAWTLAAKRGRDGRDGTNGKDLTKGVSIK